MQTIRMERAAARVLPFLAGPLVAGVPRDPMVLPGYAERFLSFVVLMGTWTLLLVLTQRFQRERLKVLEEGVRRRSGAKPRVSAKTVAIFVVLAGALLLALHTFKTHFTSAHLYFVLFLAGVQSWRESSAARGKIEISLFLDLVFTSGVAYFTFLLIIPKWPVEPFIIALGVGALTTAVRAAPYADDERMSPKQSAATNGAPHVSHTTRAKIRPGPRLRTFLFLTLAGPTFLCAPAYLGILPLRYLVCIILIPLAGPALNSRPAGRKISLASLSARLCVALALVLIVLRSA